MTRHFDFVVDSSCLRANDSLSFLLRINAEFAKHAEDRREEFRCTKTMCPR